MSSKNIHFYGLTPHTKQVFDRISDYSPHFGSYRQGMGVFCPNFAGMNLRSSFVSYWV
jgi:hypothetical protein